MGQRVTKTNLTPDEVQYLSTALDLSTEEILRWYQQFMIDCPNGKLDRAGFHRFYRMLHRGQPQQLDWVADCVFNTFDFDKSGYLSFGEFLIAYIFSSCKDYQRKLNFAFQLYDINQNNIMEFDELVFAIRKMYELRGQTSDQIENQARQIFDRLDRNIKDGRITQEEFVAGCLFNPAIATLLEPFV
jgi:neuronal calcium sensor 1